jgi:hypothetical protein
MPCEGDAFFRLNGEREVAEKNAGAVFDAEILNGKHGGKGIEIRMMEITGANLPK